MNEASLRAVAKMLVLLAGVSEAEQIDVLAAVARTWCEKESRWFPAQGSVRLWAAALDAVEK